MNLVTIGLRASGRFLHHGEPQRHVDLTGAARRPDDDASLDADLHHHVAVDDGAFARDAREGALVFQRQRRLVAGRADGQRGGAHANVDAGAIDVGLRAGDGLPRACGRAGEEARDQAGGPEESEALGAPTLLPAEQPPARSANASQTPIEARSPHRIR